MTNASCNRRSSAGWVSAALLWGTAAGAQMHPVLTDQTSGTEARLQAVSAVDERVVWASGVRSTFVRTVDGGRRWQAGTVPGPDTLQFRDVHAVDENVAYLLSSGTGAASRVYKTVDGGDSWRLVFTNPDASGFFDCMDFWTSRSGLLFGDAVEGRIAVFGTQDGGATWTRVPPAGLPPAHPGEGGFAASGTCLVAGSDRRAWIAAGAGGAARVFRTADGGGTWSVTDVPIVHGTGTSGAFSVAFRDDDHGLVFGGELADMNARTDNVARTTDGGRTWTAAGRPAVRGPIYGGAYVPGTPATFVAVGPAGADFSTDDGATWTALDDRNYWSVTFVSPTAGWMVGPAGRITNVRFDDAGGAP